MESLNQLVERRSVAFWLGIGLVGVAALLGSTVIVAGVADTIAVAGAAVLGSGATGAAFLRRRLAGLPLELAPTLARSTGALGDELTARAWLGRGRTVEAVVFTVSIDGVAVDVLSPSGPAVGRVQVVFPASAGEVTVSVSAVASGQTHSITRVYTAAERTDGRFHPGVAGTPLRFHPGRWGQVIPSSTN